jgi:hypothetical protein
MSVSRDTRSLLVLMPVALAETMFNRKGWS